jgi:hypothetical protein
MIGPRARYRKSFVSATFCGRTTIVLKACDKAQRATTLPLFQGSNREDGRRSSFPNSVWERTFTKLRFVV